MEITNKEILEISLKIERAGKVFYTEISKYVTDSKVKKFLQFMSAEEVQHEKQFRKLLEVKGDTPYGWEKAQEVKKFIDEQFQTDIFPNPDDIFKKVPELVGLQDALDFAIEAERTSAEFYSLLGEYCNNMDAKTDLVLLEKAEQEHLRRKIGRASCRERV